MTKVLKEGDSLLIQNKIIVNTDDDALNKWYIKDELQTIPHQKANKKTLYLFPLKLWFYASVANKRENKFRWWLKNKVGEAPVIFDSTQIEPSKLLLTNYYQNKGYFFTDIKTSVEKRGKKKVVVVYNITPNRVFNFRNTYFPFNSTIDQLVYEDRNNTLLKKGTPFNIVTIKNERQRIADYLNNNGYYYFTKDYVFFEMDTFHQSHEIDIRVKLATYTDSVSFEKYTLDSVFIFQDFNPDLANSKTKPQESNTINEYKFTYYHHKFRDQALLDYIYFYKDSIFQKANYLSTIQKLSELGEFKLINVFFTDKYPKDSVRKLDCHIVLSPYKKQFNSFNIEAYNNFEGLFGSGLTVAYNNRNLTKNMDKLNLSVTFGAEFNFNTKATNNVSNRTDILISGEYYINKFLLPFNISKLNQNTRSRSKITASYNFENRIGFYKLHNTNFAFGYEWSKVTKLKHTYLPISINNIYLPDSSLSDAFRKRIEENNLLKNSFSENFFLGSQYSFIYSKLAIDNQNFSYSYRFNIESAGNFIELGALLLGNQGKSKTIIGRSYAQYVKFVHELRMSNKVNEKASINSKIKFGMGIPYGNSTSLPYVKQFFVGGPNSIRAFPVRTMGPGGYKAEKKENQIIDELGDILLEASLEYRFNIFKWFNGVVFLDAGNVWTRQPDPNKPNAEFQFNKFFKQIAIGTGVGIRLDFDYFVVRYDLGFPVKVNYDSDNSQWVIKDAAFGNKDWRQQNLVHNIAVGYPF